MWQFIRQKWLTLLLSVFLGWVLWMYANRVESRPADLVAYFEPPQAGADFEMTVTPQIAKVTLGIRGPTGAIYEATRSDRIISIVYDPGDPGKIADGKTREVRFDRSMVRHLPPDVEVVAFEPPSFELTVRRQVEMVLPVGSPDIIGTPDAGYEVYDVKVVRPREVTVRGPKSVLTELTEVRPEPVDVTGRNRDYRDPERRILRTYDVAGTTEHITCKNVVEILVGIRRKSEPRTIKGVPIKIAQTECRPPALPVDIEIISPTSPIDLEIEGPPEAMARVKPESLCAFINVDVSKFLPGDDTPRKETLIVWGLPEGVRLTKRIEVTARIRPKAEPEPKPEPATP